MPILIIIPFGQKMGGIGIFKFIRIKTQGLQGEKYEEESK